MRRVLPATRMGRVTPDEMDTHQMALSAARVYVIASAAASGREPEDCEFQESPWIAVVEDLAFIGEGEFSVATAGLRCCEVFHAAISLPQLPEEDARVRLAWQAVACHISCMLEQEEDDEPLEEREYRWAEWVQERIKETANVHRNDELPQQEQARGGQAGGEAALHAAAGPAG